MTALLSHKGWMASGSRPVSLVNLLVVARYLVCPCLVPSVFVLTHAGNTNIVIYSIYSTAPCFWL